MSAACRNCRFYRAGADEGVLRLQLHVTGTTSTLPVGECRVNAPKFKVDHWGGMDGYRSWPIVQHDDWCGVFVAHEVSP